MRKIALITGANKGIGFETARQLGRKGYAVIIGARDEKRGERATSILMDEGIEAIFLKIEPSNATSASDAADQVEKRFGVLDVLVNNAGYFSPSDGADPADVSLDVFRETYEINVFGLHQVTRSFWPLLNKSEAARLVNVSSLLGSLSAHSDGTLGDFKILAYDSSKAAVNMLTTHYAYQWRNTPHKANCIHPGSVKTDMNAHGELSVEEGAKTSVDLAITGEDGPNGGFFHLGQPLPW